MIVRAGANPAAQAAAAAAVGASAVLLADPRERPLPALAAGRAAAPVIGVTGEAAEAVLKLKPGSEVSFGETERAPSTDAAPEISPFASQGPSAGGLPKPDLAAAGSAMTVGPGGRAAVAGGSAIAAARAAAAAARLARTRPELSPDQLRAALIAAADPANLPPDRAGAGVLRAPDRVAGCHRRPADRRLRRARSGQRRAPGRGVRAADAARDGRRERLAADALLTPGTPAPVTVRLDKPGITSGRLEALDPAGKTVASVPWLVRPDEVEPIAVGSAADQLRRAPGPLHARFVQARRADVDPGRGAAHPRSRRRRGPGPPQPHVPRRRARADAGRVLLHASERGPRPQVPRARLGAAPGRADDAHVVKTVTLYSRPGCHLCDEARDVLERLTRAGAIHRRGGRHHPRRRPARALPGADPGRRAGWRGVVRLRGGRGSPLAAHSLS